MTSLHKIATDAGAIYAKSYEFNGRMEPPTYTATLSQLEAIADKHAHTLLQRVAKDLKDKPIGGRKIGEWANDQAQADHALWCAEFFGDAE